MLWTHKWQAKKCNCWYGERLSGMDRRSKSPNPSLNQSPGIQSLSYVWLLATPWTAAPRLPCPPLSPWVCSNSCPLIQGCHPTISSCCPLLLLPSIFPSIRVFSSELALLIRWPKYWSFNISPSSEYSGLISLQSKGLLSRVFSSTTVQKHQFFDAQPSLWSNSHICTGLLEKP